MQTLFIGMAYFKIGDQRRFKPFCGYTKSANEFQKHMQSEIKKLGGNSIDTTVSVVTVKPDYMVLVLAKSNEDGAINFEWYPINSPSKRQAKEFVTKKFLSENKDILEETLQVTVIDVD